MYNFNPYQPYEQGLIRVTGIDGAKAYQMRPNSTVALFDANNDYFYIKTTDGAGFPTIRTFKFDEVQPTQMSVTNDYVSRAEFEELRKEIQDGKYIIQQADSETTD
jgi:outer membrane receptor protein involved in Fe transport